MRPTCARVSYVRIPPVLPLAFTTSLYARSFASSVNALCASPFRLRRSIHSACTRILRASFLRRSIHLACERSLRVSSCPLCSRFSCSLHRVPSPLAPYCVLVRRTLVRRLRLRFFRTPCGSDLWFHFRGFFVSITPSLFQTTVFFSSTITSFF